MLWYEVTIRGLKLTVGGNWLAGGRFEVAEIEYNDINVTRIVKHLGDITEIQDAVEALND